jgi:hypothetical protein
MSTCWRGVGLGLLLTVPACAPPPPATPAPAPDAQPAPPSPSEAATPELAAESDAGSNPNAPSFDEEMKCRRDHCYIGGAKRCFDVCYRYNHPRHPQEHATCDDGCRRSYGVVQCEQACAFDRRAFASKVRSPVGACDQGVAICRGECADRENECELRCLTVLRQCEAEPPR